MTAQHLHAAFLDASAAYESAIRFWQDLWESCDPIARARSEWTEPWFDVPKHARDGNPIFTAVSWSAKKGIRIIQYPPTSKQPEFDFWIDSFGDPFRERDAISELVIACALSQETSVFAKDLMSQWIHGGISWISDQPSISTLGSPSPFAIERSPGRLVA